MVDDNARLRNVEERLTTLQRRFEVIEQNWLNSTKRTRTEIRTINGEFSEIREGLNQLKEGIVKVSEEIKHLARKDDVEVLKKYIDLWNPMSFVHQSEIENLVKQVVEENKKRR